MTPLARGLRAVVLLAAVCAWFLLAPPAALAEPAASTFAESAQVLAQGGADDGVDRVNEVSSNLRTWLMQVIAGFATLILTIGGFRYLLAGGDMGEIDAAKRLFKAAAIGYALAVLAPVLVGALSSIVGPVR